MSDLIEALTIFRKYADPHYPTHCEHDIMLVVGIKEDEVTPEDGARLDALGFFWCDEYECWASFRFGSA
jgi:hypothetical protein